MPPFDDDDGKKQPPKKIGLKLNNKDSMFANVPKKPSKQEFEKIVHDSQERNKDYKERAMELAISYRKMLDDKTVTQNKNIFAADLETEVIGKLAELAIDINNDDQEGEGMGSVGLTNLLFRCLLIQRDKINNLDYAVNQLESAVKKLESEKVDIIKPSE